MRGTERRLSVYTRLWLMIIVHSHMVTVLSGAFAAIAVIVVLQREYTQHAQKRPFNDSVSWRGIFTVAEFGLSCEKTNQSLFFATVKYTIKLFNGAGMFSSFIVASTTGEKYVMSICFARHFHLLLCWIPGMYSARPMTHLASDIKFNKFFCFWI